MAENKEIFDKVVEIMSPYTKNRDLLEDARLETRILEDLNVNSARLVDIILAFEDHFDIEIDDDAADKVETIGDAVNLIVNLKS